ncbi:MAG TPA: hypothetical protein VN429_04700 [Methanospirillum sp.]|uniref:hypothetical protein n=1 Tax=Methanospirillum sp. TaxID=45200 RepID=UPI002CEABFED|nr:hypothetical protein [Methanospirillum sp.]HWQ63696.1 hypothetical protein [Methanospirillum sp.]
MKTEFFDRYGIRLLMIPLLSVCVSCSMGAVVTPPFDTSVIASSSVANIQNVAYESHLGSTLIGEDENVPAAVKYSVSITGANRTDGQGAEGIARTRFVVSVLEGRDTDLNTSSEHVWRDNTEVAGTIRNLMKNFEYKSGMRI